MGAIQQWTVRKKPSPLDITQVLQAQIDRMQQIYHFVTRVCIQFGTKDIYVNAMIDCGSLWNFMDQLLIWRHKISRDNNVPKKLLTVGGHLLKIYQHHVAVVEVRDWFKNVLSG